MNALVAVTAQQGTSLTLKRGKCLRIVFFGVIVLIGRIRRT